MLLAGLHYECPRLMLVDQPAVWQGGLLRFGYGEPRGLDSTQNGCRAGEAGMSRRILVVEDDLQILRDLLTRAGFEIIEAKDGEEDRITPKDRQSCRRRVRLLGCCRREMLAASSSLHDPKRKSRRLILRIVVSSRGVLLRHEPSIFNGSPPPRAAFLRTSSTRRSCSR
jgi:hypothetical protein